MKRLDGAVSARPAAPPQKGTGGTRAGGAHHGAAEPGGGASLGSGAPQSRGNPPFSQGQPIRRAGKVRKRAPDLPDERAAVQKRDGCADSPGGASAAPAGEGAAEAQRVGRHRRRRVQHQRLGVAPPPRRPRHPQPEAVAAGRRGSVHPHPPSGSAPLAHRARGRRVPGDERERDAQRVRAAVGSAPVSPPVHQLAHQKRRRARERHAGRPTPARCTPPAVEPVRSGHDTPRRVTRGAHGGADAAPRSCVLGAPPPALHRAGRTYAPACGYTEGLPLKHPEDGLPRAQAGAAAPGAGGSHRRRVQAVQPYAQSAGQPPSRECIHDEPRGAELRRADGQRWRGGPSGSVGGAGLLPAAESADAPGAAWDEHVRGDARTRSHRPQPQAQRTD
eukprot:scaffold14805_cov121-Isochrysis_galbana.AAC.4